MYIHMYIYIHTYIHTIGSCSTEYCHTQAFTLASLGFICHVIIRHICYRLNKNYGLKKCILPVLKYDFFRLFSSFISHTYYTYTLCSLPNLSIYIIDRYRARGFIGITIATTILSLWLIKYKRK